MRPLTQEEIEYYDLQPVDMRLEYEQIELSELTVVEYLALNLLTDDRR